MKKFKPLEVASWAKAEQRQKRRAERRAGFFQNVRFSFILLFFATILVFIHNYRIEAGRITSAQIHRVTDKATLPDRLRDNALNYEKNVDSINHPENQPKSP